MQKISSPADKVVDETSREKAWSSSRSSGLQIGLAARMRAIEREREGVPDRRRPRSSAAAMAASRSR